MEATLQFHPWGTDNLILADLRALVERLGLATHRQLHWTEPGGATAAEATTRGSFKASTSSSMLSRCGHRCYPPPNDDE